MITINHYLADKNESEILNVSGSYKFNSWTKTNINLIHSSGIETSIYLDYEDFLSGKYYEVTYTVTLESNSGAYVQIGNTIGTKRTTSGTYIETLKFEGLKRIYFLAYGNVTISNIIIREYVVYAEPLDLADTDGFINRSWTISYSIKDNKWVSFHSYLPDYYISIPTDLFSYFNDELSPECTLRDHYNNYIVGHKGRFSTYQEY